MIHLHGTHGEEDDNGTVKHMSHTRHSTRICVLHLWPPLWPYWFWPQMHLPYKTNSWSTGICCLCVSLIQKMCTGCRHPLSVKPLCQPHHEKRQKRERKTGHMNMAGETRVQVASHFYHLLSVCYLTICYLSRSPCIFAIIFKIIQ